MLQCVFTKYTDVIGKRRVPGRNENDDSLVDVCAVYMKCF